MKSSKQRMTRRRFLQQSAQTTGFVAASSFVMSSAWLRGAAARKDVNPFAYDLGQVSKTDPKLIGYEQTGRFKCPQPEPHRMMMGPQDRLYIAGKHGVSILGRDSKPLGEIATSEPARCVAVEGEGKIYIGLREHVEVFDAQGQRLTAWEAPGKKTWLTALAVGPNEVFAADSGNRVVLRYDKSGKVTGRLGQKDRERNIPGLIVPSPYMDLELAKDGLLRVSNFGRHRVEAYTANGDLEFTWGKPSGSIQGFCGCCNPVAVTMLPDGRHVTCEKGLPRVKVYSADGAFECVVAGLESFPENMKVVPDLATCKMGGLDAAVDSRGQVYILDLVTGDVHVMKRKAQA